MKPLLPLIIIFALIAAIILGFNGQLAAAGLKPLLLQGFNAFFFAINYLVYLYQKSALDSKNPNVFVRSVMGGMMFKMFLTILLVLAYRLLAGAAFEYKSVVAGLVMYLIYMGAEVAAISKLNANKKNG